MDDTRDRVGSLGSTKLRLAKWVDVPYQRSYRTVAPASTEIPGAEGKVAADPSVRYWHVDDWSGGEGETIWRPGLNSYFESTNVRPHPREQGLIVGAQRGWTGAHDVGPFNGAQAEVGVVVAQGKPWALGTNLAYEWDLVNDRWKNSIAVTFGSVVWSVAHGNDDWIYAGTYGKKIIRFKADATNATWFASWGSVPALAYFDGKLYGLHSNDLYLIDQSTSDTRTLVADPAPDAPALYAGTPISGYSNIQRIVATDVGLTWFNPTDDGTTTIYEYNAYTDSHSIIGMLPKWGWPDDILFYAGFVFIAFRMPQYQEVGGLRFPLSLGTTSGDAADNGAFIYYQRGSQRGVLGPLRSTTAYGRAISIGGVIGDDLIFRYDGAYWAYNLSAGGMHQIATSADVSTAEFIRCVTYGSDIFADGALSLFDYAVERIQTQRYTTSNGTIDLGRYDFGWLGIEKILYDVTVVADVPSGCTIKVATRAENGSFTTHADTMDDTETNHTFVISTGSSSLTGKDFEVRLILDSNSETATPTIRSVIARATTAVKQIEWTLNVDIGTPLGGRDGDAADRHSILTALQTMSETNQLWTFTDPWHRSEYGAAESFDVTVDEVTLPDAGAEGTQYARVVLRELSPAYNEGVPVG